VNKERKLRADLLRRQVLLRFNEGASVGVIAGELDIHPRTVVRHLSKALETESLFPSNLTSERIAELRALAGEKLRYAYEKVAGALSVADPAEGITIARLAEASAKLVEREARLFGLDQPQRIVEEQTRRSLEVLVHSSGKGLPMLSWDRSFMEKPIGPVPGLTIYEGARGELSPRNNGDAELQDSASD
jgi:hypothetical protein